METPHNLKAAIEQLNRMYGPVVRMGELPPQDTIPTGLPELDKALGGIPKGKIIEIYGPEGAGKTALALQLARQVENVLYIDADRCLTPAHKGVCLLSVETLEDALNACKLAAPAFDLIVVDTLTALPTREDMRCEIGEYSRINSPAKLLSNVLPQLLGILAKSGCTLIFINQLREAVGVMFGNPERVPGGHALKHFASMRLEVRRIEVLRKGQESTGQRVRVNVVKNKCGVPYRTVMFDLMYGSGFQATSMRKSA